jgi:outer membrane protein TolC
VAKQLLEFYIGREIKGPLADEDIPLLNLGDVFRFLEARDKRADVLAAKENYHLYQANVMSAQSGFFPWVTLDGNYYTRRVGFQSGIDWDVVLTVDVPIFDGMQTVGATKKAYAEQEIARLEYELVRRQADLEIRNFFETYHAMQDEDKALKEAVDAAKSTYDIQSQDYRTNLVNNLDVLDALRRSEDSQNSWLETHFDMKRSYWKFKVSVGEAP